MELNQQQALNVLIKAAQVAQSKGAFTLDDAEMVNKAIKVFVPKKETTEVEPDENKAETTETTEAAKK
jgi:hypothetical protein